MTSKEVHWSQSNLQANEVAFDFFKDILMFLVEILD